MKRGEEGERYGTINCTTTLLPLSTTMLYSMSALCTGMLQCLCCGVAHFTLRNTCRDNNHSQVIHRSTLSYTVIHYRTASYCANRILRCLICLIVYHKISRCISMSTSESVCFNQHHLVSYIVIHHHATSLLCLSLTPLPLSV